MKTTKKLLSVLLSVLMILSTMSAAGVVAFAKDTTHRVEAANSEMIKAYSGPQEDNKIVINGIVIDITGDGAVYFADGEGLTFEGDDATFTISLENGYNIDAIRLDNFYKPVVVTGDNWANNASSFSNFARWEKNAEKGIEPQKSVSFTAVEGSVKDIIVWYTVHEHEFVDYICECGEEDLENAKTAALREISWASTEVNSEATEAGRKAVNEATTVAEVTKAKDDALAAMYAMDLADMIEWELSNMEEWLIERPLDYEEHQGIYEEAVAAVKAQTTIDDVQHTYYIYMVKYNEAFNDELNDIFAEAYPEGEPEDVVRVRNKAAYEFECNIPEEVSDMKGFARAFVAYVNAAVAEYLKLPEEVRELNRVKAAALIEIEDAQYDANSYDVFKVSTDPVENATTAEEVESAKTSILAEIAAIEKAFNDGMEEAIKAINDAAGTDPSEAVQEIVYYALYYLQYEDTLKRVNEAKEEAIRDIMAQIASEKPLDEVKADAIADVNKAKDDAKSAEAKNISTDAITNAETAEDVINAKVEILKAIEDAEKALADAKTAAVNAVNAEAGENASDAVKAIVKDAVDAINAKDNVNDVNAAKTSAVESIKAQKASETAAAELAAAKEAGVKAINDAKTNENHAIAETAITDINAATTVDAVTAIKTKALADMKKADEDAAAAAAKALADAKTAAVAEINAAKTEANKAVAEKAVSDINAATKVDDVATIKTKALNDMAKADKEAAAAAKALADAKTAAIAEVKAKLTSDSTDEEKTLVDEAVKAIENAKTVNAVANAKSDFNNKWKALHTTDEPSGECNHMCHKGGFMGFIWKIVRFFSKLFGTNKTCSCGAAHY